ncbi:glycosyltransferase family 2 protein, partial [Pluralibacter gergoviae]|nr:glycosyltransferase family 2 protein [Pluralibacter gergoviae]
MENYSISIIMPAYNCRATIKRAVESVINQTYSNWHLYIINDRSEEDLHDILSIYQGHNKITIIHNEKNVGAANSRNIGIDMSKEDYIAFLDSDDEWLCDKLNKQMIAINNGYNIVITSYNYISKKKNSIIYNSDEISIKPFLKKKMRVCFSSLLHKRVNNLY